MSSSRDALRARYDRATADLDPPFAIVDLDAFDANSAAMLGRAAGKPLRVPSKSVRVRALIDRALAQPGWRGVMAYTLPEAIWLAGQGTSGDILVAYPTADRAALHRLATDEKLAATVTVMVDSTAQLDLIDAVVPASERAGAVRVCIDLDGSWRPARGVHIGVRRSPVHSARQAGELAAAIAGRAGFRLVGLMCYEAQIAGLGDAPPGRPVRGALIRAIQSRSFPELLARRAAVVAEVRRHADLEFVNGGGTGSVQATAQDPAVTEVAAGSGLFGPWLFDGYRRWRPQPAAFFAMSVVRRPDARVATVLGGGWIASGETSPTRQPLPWLPEGLELIGTEGAGEVQTPLVGPGAAGLRLGDRVYFRHAKAGELCEHVNEVHLVSGDTIVDVVPTYRGEGKVFL
ncbi:amino acid deaminase/aldolase [Dactylosporangium aurantiacum]|uniref:Amino acid deaminase/aldolase n=1 Tax=Dactylosporangium aurantiacum TaxID=35754 RepID=A0A9Q9MMZ5_9ACTN|nr:amino acid deaminase/aldolase [Dactylosporangium aurantiacum]MDG6100699.1 amino acid deaminase/aldolase [Dactylosporangium aurantiacum]UWZ55227.1 amino acid deaminase/aldolase [Dactylosporangium aurantiacum]